jgi:Lar family restriction alleviation protein
MSERDIIEHPMDEAMNDELKPCPFCGSYTVQIGSDGGVKDFLIHCFECGAEIKEYGYDTKDEVIRRWNKRSDSPIASFVKENKLKIDFEKRYMQIIETGEWAVWTIDNKMLYQGTDEAAAVKALKGEKQ